MARFPMCNQAGISVSYSEYGTPYVKPACLSLGIIAKKLPAKNFAKLCKIPIEGIECYLAWDVEEALTPMMKTEQQKKKEEIINLFKKK